MSYQIVVSNLGKEQLEKCVLFVANVNIHSAYELKNKLIEGIKSLSDMPERFPYFQEEYIIQNKYRKMFIQKYYLIIYQIKDSKVFIDYIIDAREDYSWLIAR